MAPMPISGSLAMRVNWVLYRYYNTHRDCEVRVLVRSYHVGLLNTLVDEPAFSDFHICRAECCSSRTGHLHGGLLGGSGGLSKYTKNL